MTRILLAPGDSVPKNAPPSVIEAMKTERTLRAPMQGTVARVLPVVGEMIEEGTELVSFVTVDAAG